MSFGPEARAAIPALIAMANEDWMDSADMDRRILSLDLVAIQALSKIAVNTESSGQVVATLTELVQEKSPNRCAAAVEALGEFGPAAQSSIPALIRTLPWSLPPMNRSPSDRGVVIRALCRIGSGTKSSGDVIAALARAARTGMPGMQWEAADALGDFGPAAEAAVPDLIRAIEEAAPKKHYQVAWRASVALGRIAPGRKSAGEAIEALLKLLRIRPPEPNFRIAAADALGDFGPAAEAAVPDLIVIMKEPSSKPAEAQVMSTVARALVRIAPGTSSNERAMRALTEALPRLRSIANERGMPEVISKAAKETLAKIEGRM
jgi:HEAT repeat protein